MLVTIKHLLFVSPPDQIPSLTSPIKRTNGMCSTYMTLVIAPEVEMRPKPGLRV